jgi:tripartite-type tricarboxylate transporter receptor subunit TctC
MIPRHPRRQPGVRAVSRLSLAFAVLSIGPLPVPAAAGEGAVAAYPSRPIHILVPQGPGGAVDVVARMLADRIGGALNSAVVVENKPGANGVIGTEGVKDAAPDGYTLLVASSSTHAMAPHTMRQIPYDALVDFAPIVNVAYTIKVVMVNPGLPVRTLAEFIAYARDRPGVLNYGSTGFGSSTHLDVELFSAAAGLRLVHVPYRSAPQHNQALVNNEVQLVIGSLTTALGLLQSGKLRALAIVSERRSPLLPDVPTIDEAGLRGFQVRTWIGLVAPAGTPDRIVETLNRAVNAALLEPAAQRWMSDLGLAIIGGSAQQFDQQLRDDYAMWGDVVRRLGLRPE